MNQARLRKFLPEMMIMTACTCVIFLLTLLVDHMWVRLFCKPWFHIAVMIMILAYRDDRYARRISLGVFFCMVADLLLEFRQTLFIPGVAVFIMGHIVFISAFLLDTKQLKITRIIPVLLWMMFVFTYVLSRTSGVMQMAVVVYGVVVIAMIWRAAARIGAQGEAHWSEWAGFIGGVFFAVGDSLIALDRFYEPIAGVRYFIILTYWPALTLIGLSTRRQIKEISDGE